MRLERKVALITGGGTGIGRETALLFAKERADVIVVGRREKFLEETVEQMGDGNYFIGDVSNVLEANKIVKEVIKKYDYLDILVNNAGTYEKGSLTEMEEETWERVMKNNLDSVRFCSGEVIPYMMKKGGSIVNVSSIHGIIGLEKAAAYVASKSAVIGLTKSMALDYAKYNIRVNCICPSAVDTGMLKRAVGEDIQSIIEEHPLKRIGQSIDVAYGILYLASDESSWVTGIELRIDGGLSIK